ncbi:MAG: hypothetical protein COY39_03160 [Alphaproteobacteria bacterium CG_4_10_14_0_8_um_filter_37_21]|nr:MAG: hypothetical protein COY39_03160 [Alphaproteobacteria bacterium CG_4_10_14_0_8_um_filter_37_21]
MKTDILTDADEDFLRSIQYGNNILKKSSTSIINSISNLEIEHVKYIMLDILNAYLKDILTDCEVLNCMDSIQKVLYEKYTLDFPETFYPQFPNDDERSLGLDCIDTLELLGLPIDNEDKRIFINFLESCNPAQAHKELDEYLLKKYPQSKDWI